MLPATHRTRYGEGCRRHGLLPLQPFLSGMNEVGGNPAGSGVSVAEFHAYHQKMQAAHPLTMTALSTHDTKRSGDVGARLAVLSEIPSRFGSAVQRWSRMNNDFSLWRW